MAYIYKIVNDINEKVYVGKTENSIKKRFQQHCLDCWKEKCEKRPLYSAMRKYGIEHFHIELIEETDQPEEREIYWIEQLNTYKNRYNATKGGDGRRYLDYDLIIKTYQEIQNLDKTAKELNVTPETIAKVLRSNHIEIKSNQEVQETQFGKKVKMFTKDDVFLNEFPSLNFASRYMIENKLTNCKLTTIKQHINKVCTGRRKTAGRYKWRFSLKENQVQDEFVEDE